MDLGGVPEAERLLRDRNVEAAVQVADGFSGGVVQVVAPDRFHDDLHRIRGMLGTSVDEGVSAAGTAPALARLVSCGAQTLLDDGFGAAAGDGWIGGR